MKKILLLGSAILLSHHIQAQSKEWSLNECISYAQEHNVSIQKAILNENLTEIDQKEAFSSFLPTANFSGSHSWTIGLNQNITTGLLENQTTQFTSTGLDVSMDIYRGGQNHSKKRRADLAVLAARYQSEKIKDDVSLNVINAYLQILFNKEQLKVHKAQLYFDENQLQRVQSLVEAGAVPAGDLLDSKATVARSKQNVVLTENALKLAKLSMVQLLQLKNYENFEIKDEEMEILHSQALLESPEEIINNAKKVVRDLKITELRTEMAKEDIKIAKSAYLPTLRGFYNFASRIAYADVIKGYEINTSNPQTIGYVQDTYQPVLAPSTTPVFGSPPSFLEQLDNNKGHNFGLILSIPIFNGYSVRNNIKRAENNYTQAKLDLEQSTLELEQKVYTAYVDTKGAYETYLAAEKVLESRKLSYQYAKDRYDVGLINIFDLNQSQNLLQSAQSEALRTKYDFIFKTKILEYYFGIPILH